MNVEQIMEPVREQFERTIREGIANGRWDTEKFHNEDVAPIELSAESRAFLRLTMRCLMAEVGDALPAALMQEPPE